jgi:tetratricopeptide (TPR) repeat protein
MNLKEPVMRIPTLVTRLSLLCVGAALLACAPLSGRQSVEVAATSADDAYLAGRNHHLARRYEAARAAYEAALRVAPLHVDARNGLATLHAEQREFAQAIALWRVLTESLTMASGPGKAYLFSNLGHAYFLSGEYGNALVSLEKACLLDPLNHRSWQLLGETLRKLGHEERAQQMLSQANALRTHDFREDYAAAGGKSTVTSIERAVKSGTREETGWNHTQLHVGADGMLELRRGPPPVVLPSRETAAGGQGLNPQPVVLLEIRNGNGVAGMARTLARQLNMGELKVTRLSNEQRFGVRSTRIEYEAAYREAAERLAHRFGGAQLQEVTDCAPANLRVIIGRDIARRSFALKPPLPVPVPGDPLLAMNKPD